MSNDVTTTIFEELAKSLKNEIFSEEEILKIAEMYSDLLDNLNFDAKTKEERLRFYVTRHAGISEEAIRFHEKEAANDLKQAEYLIDLINNMELLKERAQALQESAISSQKIAERLKEAREKQSLHNWSIGRRLRR